MIEPCYGQCLVFRGPGRLRHQATVVISKTVHLDERGKADCPFCKQPHVFMVGANAKDQLFYHCFGCRAGGAAELVVVSVDGRARASEEIIVWNGSGAVGRGPNQQ